MTDKTGRRIGYLLCLTSAAVTIWLLYELVVLMRAMVKWLG